MAIRARNGVIPAAVAATLAIGCSDGGTGPGGSSGEVSLQFASAEVGIGAARSGELTLRNIGARAAGPLELRASQVLDPGNQPTLGVQIRLDPTVVSTLNPGSDRIVGFTVEETSSLGPGIYSATVSALLANEVEATTRVTFSVPEPPGVGGSVTLTGVPSEIRQGDATVLAATASDSSGAPVSDPALSWRLIPADAGLASADGMVVPYAAGQIRVVVAFGAAEDTAVVTVTPRGLSGSFEQVGTGPVPERYSADFWAHGGHAYSGTWGQRVVSGDTALGNTLYAWDIGTPTAPMRTDSVRLDARVVNDVKVSADGMLAVATHEHATDGRNGVTLLDLADPAHPAVITRFQDDALTPGVHNVWIDGTTLYVVIDGGGGGLAIVDISDPANPSILSRFHAGSSFLHDVLVRDGLAFLSHWNAGLVILDVGNGVAGGSPSNPVEVSRIELAGQTHNAWYWPAGGYVFVGEEDFVSPGIMHVVDVRQLTAPREVATFRVVGDTPHNFWLDEDREILYLAWYEKGIRALDVSGTLLGQLERQGREIASLEYGGSGACPGGTTATCTWSPQLIGGELWLADMNRGLVALRPDF